MHKYFKEIENKARTAYSIAEEARKKGLDPKSVVEIKIAMNLAQRAIGLIASKYPQIQSERIENRIKDLEKEYGFLDPVVCIKIAEEVANEKYCKFTSKEEAIDAGFRLAFAYYTLGVVAAPLEGYTHFELKKTKEGKDYFSVYYSGPIGGAGRTAASFSILLIDYLRNKFGYAKYDPSELEIKRAITELYDFHERITNLQYLPSPEEIEFLYKNIPVQLNGLQTAEREVSNYKDLERVETNRIRGGFCLILGEGIAQKAPKLLKIINKLKKQGYELKDWDFLEKFVDFQKEKIEKKKKVATGTYIQDAVAGRPIFGHPSWSGAFRLRYGRCRFSGYSAAAVNPVTMKILDDFVAVGTQLKLEKPSKAAAITVCDDIDGPIVKLKDDSVVKPESVEQAEEIKDKIKEIIYAGDILITYGDFLNRNHFLLPCGYVPEWWMIELKETATKYSDPEKLAGKSSEELEKIQDILKNIDKKNVSFESAIAISNLLGLPLYPDFIFYWSQISFEQFLSLLEWFVESDVREEKLNLPYETHKREKLSTGKRALELLGIEHKVTTANVVIESIIVKALAANLNLNIENFSQDAKKTLEKARKENKSTSVLDFINKTSKFKIKDKAGSFIGARMGRPEKAKPRELTGSPHVLFPVGEQGGRLRSVQAAINEGFVEADFPLYYCENCKKETIYFVCETCNKKTRKIYYCPECIKKIHTEDCPLHGKAMSYSKHKLDIRHYFEAASQKIKISNGNNPALVKGVRGTSSEDHVPENLAKGILRAMFNLHVNKDGTVRYDSSEVPMTQFKPKEANVSVEKLKELGYFKDMYGKELKEEDQILELKPHDVILPALPHSSDEPADETFFRVAQFIDSLLINFYDMKPFYDLKNKEELIGHMLLCIAPHNCAGVVGRIIGFSNTQGFFASPYMHAAMRRDCDGDEGAMTLLLDALLNFSREYLPAHRGSTQDAPLTMNVRIRPAEVDDMIFDVDVVKEYPLELYMAAEKSMMPNTIKVEQVKDRLKDEEIFSAFKNLYYTHETSDLNRATLCSSYKTLITMQDKVNHQMALAEKLRAVDTADVARLVIERHFLRDIKGNFHKFTRQQFRCVKCNKKYRRPPLAGKCSCGGRIIFTIAEGSIVKYLEPAISLARKYNVPNYVKQSLDLVKQAIESIFGKETEKQQELKQWF